MSRALLSEERTHPAIRTRIADNHRDVIDAVELALEKHRVVVVGMAQNPHCRRARTVLAKAGVDTHYLEYGSYLGAWRLRGVLKMWSGWPTFPMVFVDGVLVGGADQITALIDSGELATHLATPRG